MKTESRWRNEYASSSSEPSMLSHQKAAGTTTRPRFSVAYHCTTKREKNTKLPSQPTIFQMLQSMPSSLPSDQASQSITGQLTAGPRAEKQKTAATALHRLAEHRRQHLVGAADVVRTTPVGDQREDLLGVLRRRRRRLVGAHVGELAHRNVQRDRDVIEAVDRDRFLAALDFADELAAESRALAEPFLTQPVLLAQRAQALPKKSAHVLDRPFTHEHHLWVGRTSSSVPLNYGAD